MTCLVGIGDGERVWIGADSAGVEGTYLEVRADQKVFKNGDFLMAFCGSFRVRDIAQYAFNPPSQPTRMSEREFLVTKFLEDFRDVLYEHGARHSKNDVESMDGGCLVGYRGEVYAISEDFQIGTIADGYAALGCGAEVALGALHATQTSKMSPSRRVKLALEASERWSGGVRGPFKILSG